MMPQDSIHHLNASVIRHYLQNPATRLTLLDATTSTNDYFTKHDISDPLHFCLAEYQMQGRGRFNRKWVAPYAANILLSCQWLAPKNIHLEGLSLCMGLAGIRALKRFNVKDLLCKWPNDLVFHNQKIAGILIEMQRISGDFMKVIIGIGINVNLSEAELSEIGRPASSLQVILSAPQDRNILAAELMNAIDACLQQFQQNGFSSFMTEWETVDALQGREIALKLNESEMVSGLVMGVNDAGELLLKMTGGKIKVYSVGEASLGSL